MNSYPDMSDQAIESLVMTIADEAASYLFKAGLRRNDEGYFFTDIMLGSEIVPLVYASRIERINKAANINYWDLFDHAFELAWSQLEDTQEDK